MKIWLCLFCPALAWAQIGDGPVVPQHMDQAEIESGAISFDDIMEHGELLFTAKFNTYDGQSRPGTTGGGVAREVGSAPRFIRTSAPDSNSCAGCHNDPAPGGAGDIVANVFVLAQTLDPVTESVGADFSNERNTLGMNGAGPIEMLAREMTADLQGIRSDARSEAQSSGADVSRDLIAKGVHFGRITAHPDGSVDTSQVSGVDPDLIIKPFHQKGAVISLREFTNNAMNHHHGMQTVERFGVARTGTNDFDQDGVTDELTVGDVTATSLWQAALNTPGQVIPNNTAKARAIIRGEHRFAATGCADCHVPFLVLENPSFSEPNPYNPAGNLQVSEVTHTFEFDMTQEGFLPRLESTGDGRAIVRAFTDLKRHNLCDDDYQHYCNEQLVQAGVSTEEFLTRKLWDVGNTAPYGHKGDLTTITEAIHFHGGEARASRDAFFALDQNGRDEIVEFLKSLQILPEGTPDLVVDEHGSPKNKQSLAKIHGSDLPMHRMDP
ncbi:MAG: hypothetical protein KDC35_14350 [Acidobacteria bacterium]|nr:hypothetical protein [Acidobacteriota bacterium]